MQMQRLPVLYVSHGSPMLAIEPGLAGEQLVKIGQYLADKEIRAIVVLSAHWLTEQETMSSALHKFRVGVTANAAPQEMYDFYGFPDELYKLTYGAKGSPEIAQEICQELCEQGVDAYLDHERGLDHGAWVPLRFLYPQANIPVIQVSIPWPSSTRHIAALGLMLKPLREQGILLVASGSQTHNLRDIGKTGTPKSYVQPFVDWMHDVVKAHDIAQLISYRSVAPFAVQAHPVEDHFYPLLIALAASEENDHMTMFDGGIMYDALSLDHYLFETC